MTEAISAEELKDYVGKTLRPSEWLTITQERIDRFADVTGDHQFIHVDEEAAKATPLGSTVAHGFLTLSLLAGLSSSEWPVLEDAAMILNYGLDRVRFLRPVRVDARVRVHTRILSVTEKRPREYLIRTERTMEIEGQEKPAYVAQHLLLVIGKRPAE